MIYQYWMARNLTNTKIHLLRNNGITPEEAWNLPESGWKAMEGMSRQEIDSILNGRNRWNLQGEWSRLSESRISFTTLDQTSYPDKLRSICNAPYGLYYRGRLPEAARLQVAVVGARGRSSYGAAVAEHLAEELGKRGVEVISGMALGIDADSHKGCLKGGGKTYAVLGCGVDVIYPRRNDWLEAKILENGGILSEYPPGTQPLARLFPARNRIISGLSDKLIVVEARERSGSLITADYAMEQGRDVYAVPGRITDELSAGCNRLIRQGAGAVISVEDFLKELDVELGNICTQYDFRKELMDERERLVYSLLGFDPVSIGLLMARLTMDLGSLLTVLSGLKERGFIRECTPGYYVRTL